MVYLKHAGTDAGTALMAVCQQCCPVDCLGAYQ